MYSTSFLPSTCAALMDVMTEQEINIECRGLKNIVPVTPSNRQSKTPSKSYARSEKKREVMRSALLHIISEDYISRKTRLDEM